MALTQIDFDQQEEEIIQAFSKKWNFNKPKTIKQIVILFDRGYNKFKELE